MVERRYPRDRRAQPRKTKARGTVSERSASRARRHPLYGDIPLFSETTTGLDGKLYTWWRHDPDFAPPLPRGAVRGDVRKQVFCSACHVPKYFYLDEDRSCIQCGQGFTFRASEQKYWYETLKFNFGSVPVRCLACRRQRRSEHALREQIARAKAAIRASASDPASHLSLAQAIVTYHERVNEGSLDQAIASARKAAALWPESPEPLLWEGIAHIRAGRKATGRRCLEALLARSRGLAAALGQRARKYLGSM